MQHLWAGIDAGKSHHHCVVINEAGDRLLSKKIANDETEILDLIAEVSGLANDGQIMWATDMNRRGAALLISVLTAHAQQVIYLPGRTVSAAAQTYRGNGKTDAKDAAITVAGILGYSFSSTRILGSTDLIADSPDTRSYLGGPSDFTAFATVFLEIPNRSAIDLIDSPSARCNRRISAQSSTVITRPIVRNRWLSFQPSQWLTFRPSSTRPQC